MYVAVEGLPALGKSEILALLRLYFPRQILVLSELVRDVAEKENIDLFQDRPRLGKALLEALPERQSLIRKALSQGLTVVEESHLGVHAAYSAALDDQDFLTLFHALEEEILWPELFVRLEAPLEVSVLRQEARGDPRYAVPKEILSRMAGWLSAWHARRGDRVEVIQADQSPENVVSALIELLGLRYNPYSEAQVLPYLLLLGRPASGKSELIQFLNHMPLFERVFAYHIGALRVVDDFVFLWQKFLEDDLWEKLGRGRLHSRRVGENYAVEDQSLWNFLILRVNQEIASSPPRPGETVIIEFSRGGERAYREALSFLVPTVLEECAILYLHVSYEESVRRNLARYDRDRRDGILTHSVPEEEMLKTYRTDDWSRLASEESGYLSIRGFRVPYVTVHNEPEPKSFADFSRRFKPALEELYQLWKSR
jgi:thymidylate kinase